MNEVATMTKTKVNVPVITSLLVLTALGFAVGFSLATAIVPVEQEAVEEPVVDNSEDVAPLAPVVATAMVADFPGDIYYVDNSIDDVNAVSATPDCTDYNPTTFACGEGTASVYKTITDVNLKSFLPGDAVLFRSGQTWREMLTIKKSGVAGNPITYSSFGGDIKPRITGADVITDLQSSGTPNIYSKSGITVAPNVVLVGGVPGTKKTSLSSLNSDNDWYFNGGILYVYISNEANALTVEAGVRDKVVNTTSTGNSYFTLDNLQLDSANHIGAGAGVYLSGNGATGVVVNNCDIKYNLYGVLFFTTNTLAGGHAISNSSIHDNRLSGIHTNAGSDGSTESNRTHIYNNEVYNNNGFGILAYASYWLVEKNVVYSNGEHTLSAGWSGIHIWGGPKGNPTPGAGQNNIVRYNIVSKTKSIGEDGSGISADMYANNNLIHHNIAYNNDGPGISLQSNDGNKIYNNTVYGNNKNSAGELAITKLGEIRVTGQPSNSGNPTAKNYSIKNNIAYATEPYSYAIYVDMYSYNNNPDITNNIYFAPNVGNWFLWKFHNPPKGISWNNLPGVGADFNVDPKFISPNNQNFKLSSKSYGIDRGVNVGLTTDIAGVTIPQSSGVDIGAYENR